MNVVLIILILLNVIISYKGFQDPYFFRKYEFHVGSIRAGEQIRMFSSAFLHVDFLHLGFNMLSLYLFAPTVTEYMGSFFFIVIYVGSLIFGNLLTLVMHKDDYGYRAVGASGAVTGIVFSAILFEPEMQINFMPAYLFGIFYLLFSIYGMKTRNDNIGHTAHFGGAVGGYLITLIKFPMMFTENTFAVLVLGIPIVILFIMAKAGKI